MASRNFLAPLVCSLLLILSGVPLLPGQSRSAEIERHYQQAREALAHHDLQRASQEYAEILRLDPRNAEVQAAQGVTLYGLGKPAEAASALETALLLDPGQTNAEIFLGLSRSDLGQCDRAVSLLKKHFNERTESKLRRVVGLSLLNCYSSSSELEQSLDVARVLKASYPGDPDVLYNLAQVYSQLWNATITELLKSHPDSFRVHQLAGETLEAQGKREQALQEYRKALELNPKVPRLHYRMGRLLALQGGSGDQEALDHFRKELEINPGDAASHYEMGEIFRKAHLAEQARRQFLQAVELAPDLVEARVALAKIYTVEKQAQKALKELQEAVRIRPEDAPAHYALMMVYRDLGRSQEANRELETFRKLEAQKDRGFKLLLESLLTGQRREGERLR